MTGKEECYNGTSGTYVGQFPKNEPGTSALVNEQLYTLTDLTDKLKKAYQGQEVEMVDDTGKGSRILFCNLIYNTVKLKGSRMFFSNP